MSTLDSVHMKTFPADTGHVAGQRSHATRMIWRILWGLIQLGILITSHLTDGETEAQGGHAVRKQQGNRSHRPPSQACPWATSPADIQRLDHTSGLYIFTQAADPLGHPTLSTARPPRRAQLCHPTFSRKLPSVSPPSRTLLVCRWGTDHAASKHPARTARARATGDQRGW